MTSVQDQLRQAIPVVKREFQYPETDALIAVAADAIRRLNQLEAALSEIPAQIDASAHWADMKARVDRIIDDALDAA